MSSILVFLERKPFGGAERATHLILKLLANEGFNITVVTGANGSIKKIKNVDWMYSPLLDAPSKSHLWTKLLSPSINQFKGLIKENDVVYVPRLAYPIIPLAKRCGKKVVVHLHDYQPIAYRAEAFPSFLCSKQQKATSFLSDMKNSLRHELLDCESTKRALCCSLISPVNKLCELWLNEADEIICVSKKQRDIIGTAIPTLRGKLTVIYNPLPEQPFIEKRISKQPTILYLGGDCYNKGFNLFLKGSYELLKRYPEVKFHFAGPIKNEKNKTVFENLNKEFKGNYEILGHLKNDAVLKLHSSSYALLFMSILEEPLPYAVIEAMLSGTIPISSRVGGVPEMLEGTFAEKMMFTPGEVDSAVKRMEDVLSLPEESLTAIGTNLRVNIMKKLDITLIRDQLLDVFS